MKRDCSTCICKEGSCYPFATIFDKDRTCKSYGPDYEGYIAELEKENIELKTKKIPQLERRIASIRGSHRVDVKKLNARIEQVERLKKENAELKHTTATLRQEKDKAWWEGFDTCKVKAGEANVKLSDEITLLKAQIEKMKCCYNCKHSRTEYEHCRTDKHEKWEIKENDKKAKRVF